MIVKQQHQHLVECIAVCQSEWGKLHIYEPSADNRACVIVTEVRVPEGTKAALEAKDEKTARALLGPPQFNRIIFNERVVAELGLYELSPYELSFDGRRLATSERRRDGQPGSLIRLNGEAAYETPLDTIYRVAWLDADRLAWYGWNEDKRGSRYFVNGVETTGEVEFEQVWGERWRTNTLLWERGTHCVIHDDGKREHHRPMSYKVWQHAELEPLPEPPEMPTEARGRKGRGPLVITYRGRAHPPVDEIETNSGLRCFAFNADDSKVAYIAIQHNRLAGGAGSVFMAPLALTDAVKAWAAEPGIARGDYGYVPLGRWIIEKTVGLLMLPASLLAALLCNPYFGPLYALEKSSQRWYPVADGRRWQKGYAYANEHFYTPFDELVVTATEHDGKQRVVINEEEGPPFDEVKNARFLTDEDCVSYLGRIGDVLYRVTVR